MTTMMRGHGADPALGVRYRSAPITEELDWQIDGLCREADPVLWYPDHEVDAGPAVQICQDCPVLTQCRDWAMKRHEVYGVWGGMSERDRAAIWAGKIPSRRYLRPHRRRRPA